MSKEKELIRNTIILAIGTMLPKVAVFITLPIYTKYLTQTEYGVYDLIATIVSLIIPIITLQIQLAVFRHLIGEKELVAKKRIITTSLVFVTFTSCITVLLALFLFRDVSWGLKITIIIYFILDTYKLLILQISRALNYNKHYAISSIIDSFANLILVIPFIVFWNLGLQGLLLSITLSTLIGLLYLIKKCNIKEYVDFRLYSKESLIDLLKYSVPMIPNTVSWWIVNTSDRLIITGFLGIDKNAIYAASNKIPSIYNLVFNAFVMAWQESTSRNAEQKDVSEYYSSTFSYLYNFLVGGIIVLISITPILFNILIDESYAEAFYQIPILYMGLFFSSFGSFYGGIYVGLKNTKKIALSSGLAAIINIIINLFLVQTCGLYAASISTLISYFIIMIYRAVDIQKEIKIKYNFINIFLGLIVIAISCMSIYILKNVVGIIVGILVSVVIAIIMNRKMIKLMYAQIKNILEKRKIKAENS